MVRIPIKAALVAAVALLGLARGADAETLFYFANLSGDNVRPSAVETEARGRATLSVNTTTQTFDFSMEVTGILIEDLRMVGPNATAFHIHRAPVDSTGPIAIDLGFLADPVATADGFTVSITSATFGGSYGGVPGLPFEELLGALRTQQLYVNIHTQNFPAGEIRGQVVPEPATLAMSGIGLVGLLGYGWRRRRRAVNH